MTNKPLKKSKSKYQTVLLANTGKKFDGLSLYAGMDSDAVKLLSGRDAIEARIPVDGRSLDANALWAVWYNQIAKGLGEQNALQVKNMCKLHFGVPILRAENEEFREVYDRFVKCIAYEEKLKFMTYLSVTRLLSKKQGVRYQEAVQNHFSDRILLEVL